MSDFEIHKNEFTDYVLFCGFFVHLFTTSSILHNVPAIHLLSLSNVTTEHSITAYIFIQSNVDEHLVDVQILDITNYMLLFMDTSSAHMYAFLFSISPRVEMLSHRVSICSTLAHNNIIELFSNMVATPTNGIHAFSLLYSLTYPWLLYILGFIFNLRTFLLTVIEWFHFYFNMYFSDY